MFLGYRVETGPDIDYVTTQAVLFYLVGLLAIFYWFSFVMSWRALVNNLVDVHEGRVDPLAALDKIPAAKKLMKWYHANLAIHTAGRYSILTVIAAEVFEFMVQINNANNLAKYVDWRYMQLYGSLIFANFVLFGICILTPDRYIPSSALITIDVLIGPMDWHSARAECQSLETDLPIVRSAEANERLAAGAAKLGAPWIWLGASDEEKEGKWVWVDGTPVDFEGWANNQPDDRGSGQDFAELRTASAEWYDWGFYSYFLCEGDGIISCPPSEQPDLVSGGCEACPAGTESTSTDSKPCELTSCAAGTHLINAPPGLEMLNASFCNIDEIDAGQAVKLQNRSMTLYGNAVTSITWAYEIELKKIPAWLRTLEKLEDANLEYSNV
ncbi:hypothetical protein TeGR_g5488, partial [Tetraparma gracilis]